ncbi:MAG TPA: phosphomannomutase/phosphoglucomutase [Actinomycetota bacterium]|nr:phosphomannomutase/phosphoglucomutase [Actinomycetota bacterium]
MTVVDLAAIFKAYDIRGLYPDQLDEEVAHRVGRAFVSLLDARSVVVAHDMRTSSEPLSAAFISGAATQGADVIDMGLATTDMLYFASGSLDVPGVVFTASHNPSKYNGIKMVRAGALPVGSSSGMDDIRSMVASGEFPRPPRLGQISQRDLMPAFVEHVLSFVNIGSLRPLKVVIDAGNGMAGLTVPRVFEKLPFEVVPLYFELDGTFPNHPADPIHPENLKALRAAVLQHEAVAGMAFDGDADRVFFVDEKAEPVSASLLGAMIAKVMLERHPHEKIVYSLTCSRVVPETIVENGGEPVRTRVGHSFIKQVMAETGAVFGTEHSGHFYLRDHYRAECGVITALQTLETISRSGGTFSDALAPFRRYWNSGEINSEVADKDGAMSRVEEAYGDGRVDHTDGLLVDYEDWWFSLRPSNTEPLLRLNVEARDPSVGEAQRDRILSIIRL